MSEVTVGTTGFVNYFVSNDRTQRKIKEAFEKYGNDIAIIDGEDDWNAAKIFHIGWLLEKFNIKPLGDFHIGISGIAKSGQVIRKSDLEKFIKRFNREKYNIIRQFPPRSAYGKPSIRIFNNETGVFDNFFQLKYDWGAAFSKDCKVYILTNNFKVRNEHYFFTYHI